VVRVFALAMASLAVPAWSGCAENVRTAIPPAPTSGAGTRRAPLQQSPAYAERLLHRFASSPDAASPEAGLIFDSAGNLYGTTTAGGAHQSCPGGYGYGCGTVYAISAGKERIVYSFAGNPDASSPFAGLLLQGKTIYGTTASGGDVGPCYAYGGDGCGTVFEIHKGGKERLLYQFQGNFGSGKGDGQGPMGGLVADGAGNLYGTTPFGGANESGTIFRVTKSGVETVLYSFTGEGDGARPYSGVIRDDAGNLYGVAYFGGQGECTGGCGTVFELQASGAFETLYRFAGGADGGNPIGGMAMDAAGNLYGTAQNFGDTGCNKRGGNPGCGTVFKISAARKFKVLHVFGGSPDGATPSENVILDAQGNLYGTTSFGGDKRCNGGYSCGTVFEVEAGGTESVLHAFTGGAKDGEVPYGGVIRDQAGDLFGTTVSGGVGPCNRGCGIVFELSPPQQRQPR
jgi:uncharacterized repeat protein (TIGR03803 family)